jgi:hypothetical protein
VVYFNIILRWNSKIFILCKFVGHNFLCHSNSLPTILLSLFQPQEILGD